MITCSLVRDKSHVELLESAKQKVQACVSRLHRLTKRSDYSCRPRGILAWKLFQFGSAPKNSSGRLLLITVKDTRRAINTVWPVGAQHLMDRSRKYLTELTPQAYKQLWHKRLRVLRLFSGYLFEIRTPSPVRLEKNILGGAQAFENRFQQSFATTSSKWVFVYAWNPRMKMALTP